MKYILLILTLLCAFQANAFWAKTVFPKEVKNQCEYLWSKDGKGFVVGQVNVLIDLKNASGDLEERAYIYIDCNGHAPKLNHAPYYDFQNMTTSCMGMRITSLDKSELNSSSVFAIRPESIEVKSGPKDNKLVLVWEDASTFEIENGKYFSWVMKSKLSGNTHRGFVACE